MKIKMSLVLIQQELIMSIGSFGASAVIFAGKSAYKVAVRTGTILATSSDDFAARWDDPSKGWDASINKVDQDEVAYVAKAAERRAQQRAKALAMIAEPAAAVQPVAA
jgi:hypothetical protein